MSTNTSNATTPAPSTGATSEVDAALARLADVVGQISDADLHRAARGGGWTVAQVISHINLCTLIWLGDLERLRRDPELRFFFREEIGHDATGYPPPTVDIARRQLESTRRTIATTLPVTDHDLLARTVEIPDLGTRTIADWAGIIDGHLTGHVEQALDVLRDRGVAAPGL